MTKSKYGNIKTEKNGIRFDSKKEADRYSELLLLVRAGEIKDLRLQHEFTLVPAYTTQDGEKIRATRYLADFSYKRKHVDGADTFWRLVVEDVKSTATRTEAYKIKQKLMRDVHGISITEV